VAGRSCDHSRRGRALPRATVCSVLARNQLLLEARPVFAGRCSACSRVAERREELFRGRVRLGPFFAILWYNDATRSLANRNRPSRLHSALQIKIDKLIHTPIPDGLATAPILPTDRARCTIPRVDRVPTHFFATVAWPPYLWKWLIRSYGDGAPSCLCCRWRGW